MKIVYSNAGNPKHMKIWASVLLALALVAYIVSIATSYVATWYGTVGFIIYLVAWAAGLFFVDKSAYCILDDEAGTLECPENKKNPMNISDIDKITFCQTKRGRLRYINIHEKGVRFVDVRLHRKPAAKLVDKLLELNPAIQVKTMNYC